MPPNTGILRRNSKPLARLNNNSYIESLKIVCFVLHRISFKIIEIGDKPPRNDVAAFLFALN